MSGGNNILLQELCLGFDVFLCFGIPIIGFLLLRKKADRMLKPFLLGMAAFVISQMLIRIPLLQYVLPNFQWFLMLQTQPYAYGIFLGVTAGIFEETARLLFLQKFLKGNTRLWDGLSFGLGHGGIEAILLVGINNLTALILYPLGYLNLSDMSYFSILLGGIERIFAIAFHTGATLVVLHGIRVQKSGRYTLLAILLHGLLDSMLVILPAAFSISTAGLEIYIMVVSFLVLFFGLRLFKTGNRVQKAISENCL
ncbi:YhfC family glutamic-type intramembrane protease [Anaerocolumna sp. AGMB13020]|uniref:YhfC family glutamic-type intramembrane protease n=1 Tax=Anaerocolumna sp. AGMB13020 TaxID=3081750 RepID=UPI002955222C|nr:YhfC family glutamic-type intramembrane protease [Anaerocolumna sp. AGMB13020]WOO38152.1 YhfC family glutamic-type intramembrane protease [Anaerocolumna sp. AGMB13020]